MTTHEQIRGSIQAQLSEQRRRIASNSPSRFAEIYLKHHFRLPASAMHREIFEELQHATLNRGCRFVVAAPRGHAKSTCVSLAYVLYAALCHREPYVMIVSATRDQACQLLKHVKIEIESNALIQQDFPEFGSVTARRPAPWRENRLQLPNGGFLHALGAGQQVRGVRNRESRPSLIVADDLESPEGVLSGEQRDKLASWFEKTLLKAGDQGTNVIVVGTVLHYDALLARLLDAKRSPGWTRMRFRALLAEPERQDLWSTWESVYCELEEWEGISGPDAARAFFGSNRDEMTVGAEVLWPEREPIEELLEMRVREGRASFDSEKQNEPLDPQQCLFNSDSMRYWDDEYDDADALLKQLGKEARIRGAWDPSLGQSVRRGDYSAIVIVAKDRGDNTAYVIVADIERRPPADAIARIVEYARMYRIEQFAVEENGFQSQLIESLGKAAKDQGVDLSVSGVKNTGNKHGRISLLEPKVSQGRIRFSRRHHRLNEQLRQFPLAAHDDGPDALHMAMHVERRWEPSVTVLHTPRDGFMGMGMAEWLST
ncbi:MAG: phage terminase large subunit [Phycisphaerales bacterium]